MLGKVLYQKANNVTRTLSELKSQDIEIPKHTEWLRRAYQQGKQISQIITYIWRYGEETSEEGETARQLHTYFVEDPKKNLKKLFAANARERNSSTEAHLLATVFCPISENMIFPMFDEFELAERYPELGYDFEINVNSFQGDLADATVNDPELLKWIIPYPPKPQVSEITVTEEELQAWIKNTDNNQYIPENPYIPSSSC